MLEQAAAGRAALEQEQTETDLAELMAQPERKSTALSDEESATLTRFTEGLTLSQELEDASDWDASVESVRTTKPLTKPRADALKEAIDAAFPTYYAKLVRDPQDWFPRFKRQSDKKDVKGVPVYHLVPVKRTFKSEASAQKTIDTLLNETIDTGNGVQRQKWPGSIFYPEEFNGQWTIKHIVPEPSQRGDDTLERTRAYIYGLAKARDSAEAIRNSMKDADKKTQSQKLLRLIRFGEVNMETGEVAEEQLTVSAVSLTADMGRRLVKDSEQTTYSELLLQQYLAALELLMEHGWSIRTSTAINPNEVWFTPSSTPVTINTSGLCPGRKGIKTILEQPPDQLLGPDYAPVERGLRRPAPTGEVRADHSRTIEGADT